MKRVEIHKRGFYPKKEPKANGVATVNEAAAARVGGPRSLVEKRDLEVNDWPPKLGLFLTRSSNAMAAIGTNCLTSKKSRVFVFSISTK